MTGDLEFLTTRQIAEELSVSRTVVVSLARQGTLPARRLSNGRLVFERRMFERWIQDQYAETRRWVLEHDHDGFHGDWKDWPIGRVDDDHHPPENEGRSEATGHPKPVAGGHGDASSSVLPLVTLGSARGDPV